MSLYVIGSFFSALATRDRVNKNLFKKFFLETYPIYYVLAMHFKSPKILYSSFQAVFLFTLEDDYNKNWIFCFPGQFWHLKIKISQFFFIFVHRIVSLAVLKIRFRPKWHICSRSCRWRKSNYVFTSQLWPLKINISQIFLWIIMGRIKCSLCL
jgi:hypothetical protein